MALAHCREVNRYLHTFVKTHRILNIKLEPKCNLWENVSPVSQVAFPEPFPLVKWVCFLSCSQVILKDTESLYCASRSLLEEDQIFNHQTSDITNFSPQTGVLPSLR